MRIPRAWSFAILLVLCLAALPQDGWGRVWKDRQGRELEADFLGLVGDKVRIKRTSDGRVFEYPLEQLSDEDQEFARRTMEASKSPAGSEPAEEASPTSPAADADTASTASTTGEDAPQGGPTEEEKQVAQGEGQAPLATEGALEPEPPTPPTSAASPPSTASPSGSPFTSPLAYVAYCVGAVVAVALVWMGVKRARGKGADPDELYQMGQSYLLRGDANSAIRVLNSALRNGLSGYRVCEAHMLLGSAYVRLNDRAKALAQLRKAESINEERTGALRKVLKQKGWL
jgi:hypothetical protein